MKMGSSPRGDMLSMGAVLCTPLSNLISSLQKGSFFS
jgi:hypothetical protein